MESGYHGIQMAGTTLALLPTDTSPVNAPWPSDYIVENCILLAVTVVANSWAVLAIRKKEKTVINSLLVLDCGANVVSMAYLAFFAQSPWYVQGVRSLCTLTLFTAYTLVTWNRLVSVCIAVFRYLAVCHSVVTFNIGEKAMWKMIQCSLAFLCLASGSAVFLTPSYGYLHCMGQEETFRYYFF